MARSLKPAAIAALYLAFLLPIDARAAVPPNVKTILAAVIAPLMRQYGIPGMAAGVVIDGHIYVCNYGVASRATRQPVTDNTIFEIGSISKTFNATLATYAQEHNALTFSDNASKYLPALRGSAFDHISLRDLGTYTPGGLPLQVPDAINDNAQLIEYLQHWKPGYAAGTVRLYSNVSIGLFGLITAASLHSDYAALLQNQMFPALGLTHSFVTISQDQITYYAQGYADDNTPIRMSAGVLAAEAYGVRTTAGDLARFISINMAMIPINPAWQRAIIATHTGYDRLPGGMVQDLVWEQYRLPVDLPKLLTGNASQMLLQPHLVTAIAPPQAPQTNTLLDKTGSTNGFSAYAVFIPAQRIGIVLLANRAYPIPARVTAAYEILTRLSAKTTEP